MSSTILNLKSISKPNPSHFVAYLEKNKIYELFYELATELLIERPEDPIVFIQNNIHRVAQNRDLQRIVLLSSSNFDKLCLAKHLEEELGVRLVRLKDLRNDQCLHVDACGCDEDDENLTKDLKDFLRTDKFSNSGWIFVDLPRTRKEAEDFQRAGILPTHVIQIILNDDSERKESSQEEKRLREVYQSVLFEVKVGQRNLVELTKDCARLLKTKTKYYAQKAPSLFRIVLIGPRGSGCRRIAKDISLKFNIVHVDFDYILKQTRIQESTLGNIIRSFERKWGYGPDSDVKIKIVENRVLDYECLKKGWILTGYPSNVEDFKLLDMIATPPNRVIFIDVDPKICMERILNRRYAFTENADDLKEYKLAKHPRDERNVVENDIERYANNVGNMLEYAGSSASIIDGNRDEEFAVREKIEYCLMNSAPIGKPRIPKPPVFMDPMDIQFDPDEDDDDIRVRNDHRNNSIRDRAFE